MRTHYRLLIETEVQHAGKKKKNKQVTQEKNAEKHKEAARKHL